MKFGIHASLGVGFSPTGNDYMRLAQKAEEFGYNSIWVGDHIVVPEKIEAAYPYTPDGSVGFDRRTRGLTRLRCWPDGRSDQKDPAGNQCHYCSLPQPFAGCQSRCHGRSHLEWTLSVWGRHRLDGGRV